MGGREGGRVEGRREGERKERGREGGRRERGKEGGREEGRVEGGREGEREGGRKGGWKEGEREGGREGGRREGGWKEGGREGGRREGGRREGGRQGQGNDITFIPLNKSFEYQPIKLLPVLPYLINTSWEERLGIFCYFSVARDSSLGLQHFLGICTLSTPQYTGAGCVQNVQINYGRSSEQDFTHNLL